MIPNPTKDYKGDGDQNFYGADPVTAQITYIFIEIVLHVQNLGFDAGIWDLN